MDCRERLATASTAKMPSFGSVAGLVFVGMPNHHVDEQRHCRRAHPNHWNGNTIFVNTITDVLGCEGFLEFLNAVS